MTQSRSGDRRVAWATWRGGAGRAMGLLAIAAAACGLAGGCSERLLRENVLATTQGTVGIMLAQNPQTQVYELKIGGARNEFFLVPTGKRLVSTSSGDAAGNLISKLADRIPTTSDGASGGRMTDLEMIRFIQLLEVIKGMEHNNVGTTPEVLAEIQVNGRAKQTLNGEQGGTVDVYQRLAVGREAVRTPAAVALMANDPETAKWAGSATAGNPTASRSFSAMLVSLSGILADLSKAGNAEAKLQLSQLDAHVRSLAFPPQRVPSVQFDTGDSPHLVQGSDIEVPERMKDFESFARVVGQLRLSVDQLTLALNDSQFQPTASTPNPRIPLSAATGAPSLSRSDVETLAKARASLADEIAKPVLSSAAFRSAVDFLFPGEPRR